MLYYYYYYYYYLHLQFSAAVRFSERTFELLSSSLLAIFLGQQPAILAPLNDVRHGSLNVALAGSQAESRLALRKTHHHHLLHVGLASLQPAQLTLGLHKQRLGFVVSSLVKRDDGLKQMEPDKQGRFRARATLDYCKSLQVGAVTSAKAFLARLKSSLGVRQTGDVLKAEVAPADVEAQDGVVVDETENSARPTLVELPVGLEQEDQSVGELSPLQRRATCSSSRVYSTLWS